MALLTALYRLRPVYAMRLHVAHVNHQLRHTEAIRDLRFVQQQAARLGLPFHALQVDISARQHAAGLSPQHAAREVRYDALYGLQQSLGAARIALGHMADDQAETVLMRLLRGTSPAGLAGIAPVRLPCIRPLMTVYRQTILAFLRAEGIPWVEDSSNSYRGYLRNQVRHDMLPLLRCSSPRIDVHCNELTEMLAAENAFFDEQVEALYGQVVAPQPGKRLLLHSRPYQAAPVALQRRLLRRVLDTILPAAVTASFQHIEQLRHCILHAAPGQRLTLPGKWMAERYRETVCLWAADRGSELAFSRVLSVPGTLDLPPLGLRIRTDFIPSAPQPIAQPGNFAYIDASRLTLPLIVRCRQPGDRFHPYGAPGQKKLKAFFIDKKVPRAERDRIPVVLSGSEIVWVVGYQIAEPFKV
ncbi:MAG: tRNA lysidine(34) synthetase TilS, partial [Candidatus Tectomicrobia bacterium]|nr:tRNA lysidine(34) synthetase TilS [Candidatus Tectomicrobia bacterium]